MTDEATTTEMPTPTPEEYHARQKAENEKSEDKDARGVRIGIRVAFLLLFIIVAEGAFIGYLQITHHDASTKLLNTIASLSHANRNYQKTHSKDTLGEVALTQYGDKADGEINTVVGYLIESNLANCANSTAVLVHMGLAPTVCPVFPKLTPLPPLPKIPKAPPSTRHTHHR